MDRMQGAEISTHEQHLALHECTVTLAPNGRQSQGGCDSMQPAQTD